MESVFRRAPEIYQPSEVWRHLNEKHNAQLNELGIENFKRTIVRQYFTWMRVRLSNPQIVFLRREIGISGTLLALLRALFTPKHAYLSISQSMGLNLLTHLTWRYAGQLRSGEISALSEPEIGGAPKIRAGGRLISQDIANSLVEFDSMDDGGRLTSSSTVCELGGGYGRTAYVVKKLHRCRYIMIDIPPALAVAQWYLSRALPDAKIWAFCEFEKFANVIDEFEAADLIFLLPHQIEMIPDDYVDFFINISSLHEMRRDQIAHYVDEIGRCVRRGGHFYLKAWKVSRVPVAGGALRFEDYGLDGWNEIYQRTARIQTEFFEALMQNPE